MTPRERLLRAVRRQEPDKVPKDISWGFSPALMETFRRETGGDEPEEYFGVEVRYVGWLHTRRLRNMGSTRRV